MVNVLMKLLVSLSGLLGILLNLRKLVVFLDCHSMAFVLNFLGLSYLLDVLMAMLLHHKQKKRGRIARAAVLSLGRPNKKKRPKRKREEKGLKPTHTPQETSILPFSLKLEIEEIFCGRLWLLNWKRLLYGR